MELSLLPAPLKGRLAVHYKNLLSSCGLRDEEDADVVALMTDEDFNVVACAARAGHTLKQFAVSPTFEGEGAAASRVRNMPRRADDQRLFRRDTLAGPAERVCAAGGGYETPHWSVPLAV